MITVRRGLPLTAVMVVMISAVAGPLQAESPEVALASGCGEVARPVDPILADAFRRTSSIGGPAPTSPTMADGRPVMFLAVAAVAEGGPVETMRSREQVILLGDHRNLYRGPGSLVHTVRNVQPLPAPEQSKPVVMEKQVEARRGPVQRASFAIR
jgi:hypothetical protein